MEIHPSLWTILLAKLLHKDLHQVALFDHVIAAAIVFLLLAVVGLVVRARISLVPNHFQQVIEVVVSGLLNLMEEMIGPHGKKYLPLIGTLAFFIFISNFLGMIPSFSAATGNVNTTFACSLIVFLYYNFEGVREHGIGYLKHFMGPVWWLAPLMLIIELISHFVRPVSLGIRLFGNISGEHIASLTFYSMFDYILPIPLMALGLFAAFLQSFIFIMLTQVYLSEATGHAH